MASDKPKFIGREALVTGLAFDLQKCVDAVDDIVRAVMKAFPGAKATVQPRHEKYLPEPLPAGFKNARDVWEAAAQLYDVVDEPLIYVAGDVTLRAYMLGRAYCVLQQDGTLSLPDGKPISELNNAPVIGIYGPMSDLRGNSMLTREESQKVQMAIESLELPGITYTANDLNPDGYDFVSSRCVIGTVRFSPDAFATGKAELRVRCVRPDGTEVTTKPQSPLN